MILIKYGTGIYLNYWIIRSRQYSLFSEQIKRIIKMLSTDTKCIIFIVCIAISLASINISYGIAEDQDGHIIYKRAMEFKERGYQKSRSLGNPAYELIAYPLIRCFGTGVAKIYSLLCYVLASIFLFMILRNINNDKIICFLGTMCFTVIPVSIISGNTILETSQGIFLAILGIYFYQCCPIKNRINSIGYSH